MAKYEWRWSWLVWITCKVTYTFTYVCIYLCACVCMHMCGCACAWIQVKRSEDNSWVLILSCHFVKPKNLSHQMFMLALLPCEPSCQAWWHSFYRSSVGFFFFLYFFGLNLDLFKEFQIWNTMENITFIYKECFCFGNLNTHCKKFRRPCQCLKGLPHFQFATVSLGCKPAIKQLVNLSANTWKFVMVW